MSSPTAVLSLCRPAISHHLANADLMPGLFALGIERLPGVRATRAQGQPVRHAAVLDFVHGVGAFQEKRFTLPAERRLQLNAPARHQQLTVRVVQFDVQLVRFKAAVIGKRQADKPLFYLLRDVRPGKRQAKSGRVRLPVNPTAHHHENNPLTAAPTFTGDVGGRALHGRQLIAQAAEHLTQRFIGALQRQRKLNAAAHAVAENSAFVWLRLSITNMP